MFWNKKTIELYRDAAAYCNFHQTVVDALLPHLTPADSILDIGCGHGYLDLLLANAVKQISCVDEDAAVLTELKSVAPANLSVICGDFATLDIAPHDYLMMSFFGRLTRDYDTLKKFAKKGIITIKNCRRTVVELADQVALTRETHGDVVAFCAARGLPCQAETMALEFGQPFKTMGDVYRYLERYKPLNSGDYEDYIKRHLVAIDDPRYRYYLPKLKKFGIAVIKLKARKP